MSVKLECNHRRHLKRQRSKKRFRWDGRHGLAKEPNIVDDRHQCRFRHAITDSSIEPAIHATAMLMPMNLGLCSGIIFSEAQEGCGLITATQRLVRRFWLCRQSPMAEKRLSCNGHMKRSLTELSLLVQARPFDNSSEFSADSTIGSDPWAEAYRRKFSLSQNSKSLHAGSNPSERILIIRGIVTASMDLALVRRRGAFQQRSQDRGDDKQAEG
jgi:hypothetical protein